MMLPTVDPLNSSVPKCVDQRCQSNASYEHHIPSECTIFWHFSATPITPSPKMISVSKDIR